MSARYARILLVDDSDDVREFSRLILEQAGYSVETGSNGEEAFAKIRRDRPDLVILDVVMPRMDGLELLLKVRSDLAPPLPPIILCSGFDLTEEEALRRGAAYFLPKPIEPGDLLLVVEEVLAGRAVIAEATASQRARAGASRRATYETARKLVQRLEACRKRTGRSFAEGAFEHVSGLAHYLGVSAVSLALLRNGRLRVMAVSDAPWLPRDVDLGEMLPPARAVLETSSALVLPDARVHPSFSTFSHRLAGIRGFVGVPLVVEKAPIGVLCFVDIKAMDVQPEDLALLQLFSALASAGLSAFADCQAASEFPTRYGPGIAARPMFEEMLDAELRLLDRFGGSLELAVLDADIGATREALQRAAAKERLFGGALHDRRIAVYKRGRDGEAARQLGVVLDSLRAHTDAHAVSVIDLRASGLRPFNARDLLHLAELMLDRTQGTNGGGIHRLVIEERSGECAARPS